MIYAYSILVFANAKYPQYVKVTYYLRYSGDVTKKSEQTYRFIKYVIGYFVNAKCPNFEFEPYP